ncbi:MAG: hypothetical protein A2W26_05125 [Acidobacteria bacterium RBG_16_64_8]|nr:MAG: hypothetical protein A2W26_05125 [Acidobacteria bacterium RBG_16_64_8]
MAVAALEVDDLRKAFRLRRGQVAAVKGVSFSVQSGKIFTLLGPSGCGKTTTLRCIAGLEVPDRGRMRIGETTVFDAEGGILVPPHRRDIGMVFQSYAIWPHMTVHENVAFPLQVLPRSIRPPKKEIRTRVMEALETMHMAPLADRPATWLSGGQQQRLALARALMANPKILLLDEPLSNLDAKLREQMRFELKRLHVELGITTIYVTHDQTEALALSEEIAVMRDGVVVQQGTPAEIYRHPRTDFVAAFVGSANLLDGKLLAYGTRDAMGVVDVGVGRDLEGVLSGECQLGEVVAVSIRAEDVRMLHPTGARNQNTVAGKVKARVFLGDVVDFLVDIGNAEMRVRSVGSSTTFEIGDDVLLEFPPLQCWIIAARSHSAITERGET